MTKKYDPRGSRTLRNQAQREFPGIKILDLMTDLGQPVRLWRRVKQKIIFKF